MPEQAIFAGQHIPQTSIAKPYRHPEEVTVQFTRFTNVGMTAYQKGQYAGFLRSQAEAMVRKGVCRLVVQAEPVVAEAPAKGDGHKQRVAA